MKGFKSKSELTAEFNMGAEYLKFLCNEVMSELARRSTEARDNPRFRTIEQYYSIVRELFNQSEAIWSSSETDDVKSLLDAIGKKIDFKARILKASETSLISDIEDVQRLIYNLLRKSNMLIPIMVNPNQEEEKIRKLRTAFGLYGAGIKHAATNTDDEGEYEE